MAYISTIQTNFTSGELDPLIGFRVGVKHYYNGAQRMRNVVVIPQGGALRRDGLRYIATARPTLSQVNTSGATVTTNGGGSGANAVDDDVSTELTTPAVGTTNPFVLVHVDFTTETDVLFADVEGLRLSAGTSSGEVKWQYSTDNSNWTDFDDAIDTVNTNDRHVRRSAPSSAVSARYWRLARIGATDLSTATFIIDEIRFWDSAGGISNVRLVPFEFDPSQRYMFVFTDRNAQIFRNGVHQRDVPTDFTSAYLRTADSDTGDITSINWSQDLDTLLVVHESVEPTAIKRDGAHDEWNMFKWPTTTFPTYPFERVTSATGTPAAATGTGINFTAGAATFETSDVGKFIRGNGGYAEITSRTSATVVVVTILMDFTDTSAIPAGQWTIEEASWSNARGWPRACTFYDGRLYFAGTFDQPSTIWGSVAGNYRNYSIGNASVADAIEATVSEGVPTFVNLVPGRHFSAFATTGEFYVPASEDEALTPSNFLPRFTTDRGSKKGLRVHAVDGALIFVQREGKAFREFIFVDTEQAYQANNVSLLASHLVSQPVDTAIRKSTSTDEADYIYSVNDDGSLGVFCTLRGQNVNAWTLCETDGDFNAVGVIGTDSYFAVDRTIDETDVRFIEVFDSRLRVDAGVIDDSLGAPASSASAAHLEGATVKAILDDSIQPDLTVSSGTVTFSRDAEDSYQVGLAWPDVQESEVTRLQASGKTEAVARELVYGDSTQTALGNETWIKDMPLEAELPNGTAVREKKGLAWVLCRVQDTTGLNINNNPIAFQAFGSELLDQAIPEYSGNVREDGLLGWDDFGQAEITQNAPYKMKLLGLAKGVAV
jgi:hypothetical protein